MASANEMVEATNLIIMYKEGGKVKKLTEDQMNRVIQGLHACEGAEVPIKREKGAFTIDIDVPDESIWKEPKKTVKNQSANQMEVDFVGKSQFEELAKGESPLARFRSYSAFGEQSARIQECKPQRCDVQICIYSIWQGCRRGCRRNRQHGRRR